MTKITLESALEELPLIAILRGLKPEEAADIGEALVTAGVRLIEVPLNSPQPFKSIEILARQLKGKAIVGAGTVLDIASVDKVAKAGGTLIVSPNCDVEVIAHTVKKGMHSMPGIFTATEAFDAIKAGAEHLKVFPASSLGPDLFKALGSVLPPHISLYAVGGVHAKSVSEWIGAGARGVGAGGSIYVPGDGAPAVHTRAERLVAAVRTMMD